MAKQSRKSRRFLLKGLLLFFATDLLARILLLASAPFGPWTLAENVHCRHDPLLGWSHIPGIVIPGMYGPGKDLGINNQGLRSGRNFTRLVERGKTRIVCLGDSFTLGYGVGDRETFCVRMEALNPRLEVVNMGQGGYGLDQMFLWYRNECFRRSHNILLVCYIDADINRMNADRFDIYAKPWIKLTDAAYDVMNIPVPNLNQGLWARNAWWSDLGVPQVARRTRESLIRGQKPHGVYQTQEELLETALTLFWNLHLMAKGQGAVMGIVRLPTAGNMGEDAPFYDLLGKELEAAGYPFMDLAKNFRRLDAFVANRMFIDEGASPKELLRFHGMGAHYSSFGHSLAAKWIHENLRKRGLVKGFPKKGPNPPWNAVDFMALKGPGQV